jgi:hypothetical protein
VNWKRDVRLSDLQPGRRLEVVCKKCGLARYEVAGDLLKRKEFEFAFIDEVERGLCCSSRFCRGPVRVSLTYDDKTEGFVGGMA